MMYAKLYGQFGTGLAELSTPLPIVMSDSLRSEEHLVHVWRSRNGGDPILCGVMQASDMRRGWVSAKSGCEIKLTSDLWSKTRSPIPLSRVCSYSESALYSVLRYLGYRVFVCGSFHDRDDSLAYEFWLESHEALQPTRLNQRY